MRQTHRAQPFSALTAASDRAESNRIQMRASDMARIGRSS
jgi:hypothetical protein